MKPMSEATVKVTLPEMGESVAEGSIVEWRKRVGDFVTEGDALVDVTTDKVDVEVSATASAVGAVLAEIDTSRTNGHAPASGANGSSAIVACEPIPVDVALPEMGESVTEGAVVEVRRAVGDWVEEGDVLVEVTTDKVDVEVPAPSAGRIVRIDVKAGDTVAVGAPLMQLDAAGTAHPRTLLRSRRRCRCGLPRLPMRAAWRAKTLRPISPRGVWPAA
jgi:pyruvate/2-oxoglutarate dehydrogenase complex dihydrolipoamide acyltransferase (E2) component